MVNRREFLKRGVTFVSLSLASRYMMMQTTPGYDTVFGQASSLSRNRNLLVIVQLNGGNDGLNTVIPYGDGLYYDARPKLAVPSKEILALNGQLGLHPKLANFRKFYDEGKLAILQGVGYPNANRSHFRSTDIWMTANPETIEKTGWLGRYLDESIARFHGMKLPAASITGILPLMLLGEKIVVSSIANLASYQFLTDTRYPQDRESRLKLFQTINSQPFESVYLDYLAQTGVSAEQSASELQNAVKKYQSNVEYPKDPFGQSLRLVAQIIAGGIGTQILYVTIGGFDTHAEQNTARVNHPMLLESIDKGLSALYQDVTQMGLAENVLMMTFSEFGRRVRENGSLGTDHGTAAPIFVLGHRVKGGLHGEHPSLRRLDESGDLIHSIDFRSIYATVLEDWLGADAQTILGKRFEKLSFIAR
ncbi:DUF1501 domain-containing protein [Candidatus Acetothermia bacterium]|jgi:uncharacterized protein (DUF1501 family)|nr:DUF1501 domain-containing protein [Candidatus Acetothermia bacterium]MCI2431532.1 DUF1501 domain-containing protein [Candidatus Acetothermia bacterium]MCI2436202.1 DUF1501 domain-containing protein [Candidatus Acetothermia bacterium]